MSCYSATLSRHDYVVRTLGGNPHHVLLRCVTVVVRPWYIAGCAGVVVAHMASTSVTIIVARKKQYDVFCCKKRILYRKFGSRGVEHPSSAYYILHFVVNNWILDNRLAKINGLDYINDDDWLEKVPLEFATSSCC